MQQKFNETKALLIKECETAKKAAEEVPVIKEVPIIDTTLTDKLTEENEKLKVSQICACSPLRLNFFPLLRMYGDSAF